MMGEDYDRNQARIATRDMIERGRLLGAAHKDWATFAAWAEGPVEYFTSTFRKATNDQKGQISKLLKDMKAYREKLKTEQLLQAEAELRQAREDCLHAVQEKQAQFDTVRVLRSKEHDLSRSTQRLNRAKYQLELDIEALEKKKAGLVNEIEQLKKDNPRAWERQKESITRGLRPERRYSHSDAPQRRSWYNTSKSLHCSFCGKSQNDVGKIIAGPAVYICDECTKLCYDIVYENARPAAEAKDEKPDMSDITPVFVAESILELSGTLIEQDRDFGLELVKVAAYYLAQQDKKGGT
jgi:hypothetical protein